MQVALPDRVVVVSPHLDDGVLSLGASIARATRSGHHVTILTVFGGDSSSAKPAGGWDKRAGFATEGDAARARRAEDESACAVVGAERICLSFSEADYRETLDEDGVLQAVGKATADARAVLVPGFPLTNPDHAWLTGLLATGRLPLRSVGLYAEQPYRYWVRRERLRIAIPSASQVAGPARTPGWSRLGVSLSCLRTKRRAIRQYRSQIGLLGLDRSRPSPLDRMLAHEVLSRGEAVAWLPAP